MLAYMEQVLGYGPHVGLDRLRVARALEVLPETEAALRNGDVFYTAVRELTRVVAPETESAWLQSTRGMSLRSVEQAVAGRARGDLPHDEPRPELLRHALRFEVAADTFALFRQTRVVLEDECGHALDDDQLLTAILRRALEPLADGEPGRALHQIAITVCERCGVGQQHGGGVAVPLDAAELEQALCDAEHIGRLDAETPERASQDISPAVRRLVKHRDRGRAAGCRAARALATSTFTTSSFDRTRSITLRRTSSSAARVTTRWCTGASS